jgi:hypothetical protein
MRNRKKIQREKHKRRFIFEKVVYDPSMSTKRLNTWQGKRKKITWIEFHIIPI